MTPTQPNNEPKNRNPYEILGIEPDASPEEITKAYRSKMANVHNDHHKDKDISETTDVAWAYEVLQCPYRTEIITRWGEHQLTLFRMRIRNLTDDALQKVMESPLEHIMGQMNSANMRSPFGMPAQMTHTFIAEQKSIVEYVVGTIHATIMEVKNKQAECHAKIRRWEPQLSNLRLSIKDERTIFSDWIILQTEKRINQLKGQVRDLDDLLIKENWLHTNVRKMMEVIPVRHRRISNDDQE